MTKNEFTEYIVYLAKLFSITAPSDPEIILAWYKPFEKTNLIIAKEMAQMYFKEEQGKFKLSKLVEYKSRAMAGKTYYERNDKSECKYCRGTGMIQYEKKEKGKIYNYVARCCCGKGHDSLPKYAKMISPFEIEDMYFDGGLYRLEEPPYVEVSDNIMKIIADCIGKIPKRV